MNQDMPDPFELLAERANKVAADAWTTAMLGMWDAGVWVLRLVLAIVDRLLTPDLTPSGPGAAVYQTTYWLAAVLVVVMLLVQLGVTAFRRDGRSLAVAAVGAAQFVVVWAAWLGYSATVVTASGAISRALMGALLQVDSWAGWQPFSRLSVDDITDATVATVLGLLGLLLWLAAIGHLLVMVTRAGALIVLSAMTPAAAAGLVSDAGRAWFWKSLRWFHAAAFTPVLMVLMLGVGTQITSGVAYGRAGSTEQAVGTAVPGVLLIVVSCFSPLALFKLLAFVDPTTNSGAALRAGLAASNGLRGLLGGHPDAGSAAASTGKADRSAGEESSEATTDSRFSQATGELMQKSGLPVAGLTSAGLGLMHTVGSSATAVGSDLTNQMSVGHPSYHPNPDGTASIDGSNDTDAGTPAPPEAGRPANGSEPPQPAAASTDNRQGPDSGPPPVPGTAAPLPPSQGGSPTGSAAGEPAALRGGAAGAAGSVPIVPV